jgi:hypothetical protein
MENEKRKEKQKVAIGAMHLHNTNWNHTKVMALINYKKRKHIVLKQIIDPKANMCKRQIEKDCKRLTRNNKIKITSQW